MLDRIFRHAELMDRVMERIGVDPASAARVDRGMAWYEARSRCIACCDERACRAWLECPDPPTALPRSCANAEFFRRCRMRRSGSACSLSSLPSLDGGTP
jgi:hypothetical protein